MQSSPPDLPAEPENVPNTAGPQQVNLSEQNETIEEKFARLEEMVARLEEEKMSLLHSKSLSFILCTPRRQQANNFTGKRQQAEDVEMSDAADVKSKLLSFILCTPRRQQANNLTGPRRVKDAFKPF
jgi:hypothetical protein